MEEVMEIDSTTRKSLELSKSAKGSKQGSLLHVIDHTETAVGGRRLADYINRPSTSLQEIERRLNCCNIFFEDIDLLARVKQVLKECHDIERGLQRILLGRGSPRDLLHICSTLKNSSSLKLVLEQHAPKLSKEERKMVEEWTENLGDHSPLFQEILSAIIENPPQTVKEGFISKGFSKELDSLIEVRDNSSKIVSSLETKYRKLVGSCKRKFPVFCSLF